MFFLTFIVSREGVNPKLGFLFKIAYHLIYFIIYLFLLIIYKLFFILFKLFIIFLNFIFSNKYIILFFKKIYKIIIYIFS